MAAWIALGWFLHLSPDQYLLAGIPLGIVFQLTIRKGPLISLWVRDAHRFRLSRLGFIIALGFALLPAFDAVRNHEHSWDRILWYGASCFGSLGAAFCLTSFTRQTLRTLQFCLTTAGGIGLSMMLVTALVEGHSIMPTPPKILFCIHQFLLYFPVTFILEEVVFRGVLDAHIHHPGESHPYWSALLVSGLWGLWHLPTLRAETPKGILFYVVLALGMIVVSGPEGIFLSLGWRRSGNLAVPAFVHALADAVRNTILR